MDRFLSRLHADIRGTRLTRRGATHHPKDVARGTHKEYLRMERIPLPEPQSLDATLASALLGRRSAFFGDTSTPLTLQEYGTLFGLALRRRRDTTSRNYPSGGGLYPIETYLVASIGESPLSVFHYHPTAHAFEKLWDADDLEVKSLAPRPASLPFSALIVFTSVWHRSSAKYGDLAYQHALLEAGHMSENILLAATALNLRARPMAGFNDEKIIRLLDLDENEEQPVHSITLCAQERGRVETPQPEEE